LTEEQQGGTAPVPEAIAPESDQAPENTVGTVAVADEPAAGTTDFTEETQAPDVIAAVSDSDPAASSVDAVPATGESEASAEAPTAEEPTPDEASTSDASAEEATPATTTAATDAPAEPRWPTDEQGAPTEAPTAAADAPPTEQIPPAPPRDLGPEPTTMEELLAEQDSDIKSFKHGDVVEGTVVRIDKDEILVDIGAKSEGVVSNRELYGRHAESQPQLTIGDTVLVYVLQPESQEGHAVLSLRRAGLERKWRSMQEQFEAGLIIEAPVIDHNKGGLIVDCGIRGFVPISQIVDFPRRPQNDQPRDAAQEIAEKLMPFVGRKLRLKILEVNRKANRLILSEKVALYEERREKRDELFSSLQVGQKVTGTVRSIAPFGVFIDLGGIDGLVHKSELSWNKVNNPEAGYKVGDEVEAEVIDINHERGRISLSIRRLQPDPWHSTVADFKVGDVIDGTVTKLVNFGAFVRVRDGLEGLIHISELSHQRVAHPGDVVHEGQQLKLKIISLDSERHRLGLSLKQAEEPPVRSMPEPGPSTGPRERRPRPERSYSISDAVQEPEGGIDNTLAAAFAQVRDQLAASEEAAAGPSQAEEPSGEAAPAPTEMEATDTPAAEAEAAEAPPAEAGAATATPDSATASDAETATAEAAVEPEAATAEPEPEAATAEPEPEVATAEPQPEAATEPQPEAATEPEPATEPEAAAEPPAAEPEAPAEEPAVEASLPSADAPVDVEAAVAPDEAAEPDAPDEAAVPEAPAPAESKDTEPA
jgi:small subunit ribosomal protein S1